MLHTVPSPMVYLVVGCLFFEQFLVCDAFQPLEDMIRQVFIPTLTGCSPPSDSSRLLFALPARWGGLGIFVPTRRCVSELAASRDVTEPLSQCMI